MYHRNKGTLKTELTEIKGISTLSAQKLLSHFKSVKKIKEASQAELAEIIGEAKGEFVIIYYDNHHKQSAK